MAKKPPQPQREYDFALIIVGKPQITTEIEDALFQAGCDDATFSIQQGFIYAEFSRTAPSLKDALLSAIRNIRNANVGLDVLRIDESNLVTQSEIARRIQRSRQLVHQFITGHRGPGNFPPPECQLTDGAPLWSWCAVSAWLAQNDILRSEDGSNAQVVAAINNYLESTRQRTQNPQLIHDITAELESPAHSVP